MKELIWIERFRPDTFDKLILNNKDEIQKYLKTPDLIPSFIFYSASPGTGKTSCAKVIINELGCDFKKINSSDERGIDTIREQISTYARSLSSNGKKKCIFMDEADGLTKQAQDSLRNLMETYSDNCFFIFSCNDISKITEPIQSRCVKINFQNPNIDAVYKYIDYICDAENIGGDIKNLVEHYYPDMRSMISTLQESKLSGKMWDFSDLRFEEFLTLVKNKKFEEIKKVVYSTHFRIPAFNKWIFNYIFNNYDKYNFETASKIVGVLADTEKYSNINVNFEVIFIANMMEISKYI